MSPPPGGAVTPPCAICAEALALPWVCLQIHPDHCHPCYQRNLARGCDAGEHQPPPARELTLSPREVEAVTRYQRRVLALVGRRGLVDLMTEDTP